MKTTETPQVAEGEVQESLNDVDDVLLQIAPYWKTIVAVVVLVATGIGLYGFISSNRRAAEEIGWETYFGAIDAMNPQALEELAKSGSGKLTPWAYHASAQGRLAEGMQSLYTDRDQARSQLEEAATAFTAAIAASDNLDLLNQRSMWGLGQANEGLNELEKAKAAYQKLLDRWPESALAKRAQERIAELNDPSTQEFYRWFFAQTPAAAAGSLFDTPPGDAFNLPDDPDVTIPEIGLPGGDGSTNGISTDLDETLGETTETPTAEETTTEDPESEGAATEEADDAGTTEDAATEDAAADVADDASDVADEASTAAEEASEAVEDAATDGATESADAPQ